MEILTFGECLARLTRQRGLSIAALSALLGCKSKTDVSRQLHDETSQAKREEFFHRIEKLDGCFGGDELALLREALEVSRLGKVEYRTQQAIWALLREDSTNASQPDPVIVNGEQNFRDLTREWSTADHIDILCFNSCYREIFNAFALLLARREQPVAIRHYLSGDLFEMNPAVAVAAVAPVLCDPRYFIYSVRRDEQGDRARVTATNQIMVNIVREGVETEEMLVVIDERTISRLVLPPNTHLREFYMGIIPQMKVVRRLKHESAAAKDYAAYLITCYEREKNRCVYQFKPEPCFEQIPTRDVLAAFRGGRLDAAAKDTLERSLTALHEQRFRNFYGKKKPSYLLLSRRGMRRFMETGMLTDHAHALRAFGKAERYDILSYMTAQAQNNPYFHVAFLKDDSLFTDHMYICYDGLGVLIANGNTHYELDQGLSDVLLTFDDFTKQFEAFFFKRLLDEQTLSPTESMEVLRSLLKRYPPTEETKE